MMDELTSLIQERDDLLLRLETANRIIAHQNRAFAKFYETAKAISNSVDDAVKSVDELGKILAQ